jgi:energy-converting hydrogenase Eha subunit A
MAQRRTQALHAMEQAQRRQARSLLVLHPDHNNSRASILHNRPMQKSMAICPPRSLEIDHVCNRRLLGHMGQFKVIKNKGIAYNPVKKVEDTNKDDGPKPYSVLGYNFLTLIIYFLSMTVSLVGTISLVIENIPQRQVWIITAVFTSLVAFFGLAALLIGLCGEFSCVGAAATSIFGVIPSLMLVLGAFNCDWILAALAGNLVGVPSGDTAILYWISTSKFRGWTGVDANERTDVLRC